MEAETQIETRESSRQELNTTLDPEFVRGVIAKGIRKWGLGLLLLGFIQIVASHFLDPIWGIVLILIGAASLYFRSAAMFPVYGVTLAWAMVANMLSGDLRWIGFGLFQAYWAFTTFRQFLILRRATSRLGISLNVDSPVRPDRAASLFPWTGCALTAAAPIGLVALIFVAVLWTVFTEQEPSDQAMGLALSALVDSACLGLALGVAALLARFPWRLVSVLAVMGGGLMLGVYSLLMLLS